MLYSVSSFQGSAVSALWMAILQFQRMDAPAIESPQVSQYLKRPWIKWCSLASYLTLSTSGFILWVHEIYIQFYAHHKYSSTCVNQRSGARHKDNCRSSSTNAILTHKQRIGLNLPQIHSGLFKKYACNMYELKLLDKCCAAGNRQAGNSVIMPCSPFFAIELCARSFINGSFTAAKNTVTGKQGRVVPWQDTGFPIRS